MGGMSAIIAEFLAESVENLDIMDQDLVALEKDPSNSEVIERIFRTIHTIKGTCGFLAFSKLEAVTHSAETVLAALRDGNLKLTPEITTTLLKAVDSVREILAHIEKDETEGDGDYSAIQQELDAIGAGSGDGKKKAGESGEQADLSSPATTPQTGVVSDLPKAVTAESAMRDLGSKRDDGGDNDDHATLTVGDNSLRVDVAVLDVLMNLVGELVLARNQIGQNLPSESDPGLAAASQRLDSITGDLQEAVMRARMQPISSILTKVPRFVRDLAVASGKQVEIELQGQETDLDKSVLEAIKTSLLHLVRNAVDHGIETPEERRAAGKPEQARVVVKAAHEGGAVVIEVRDDGKGLDTERILNRAMEADLVQADDAPGLSPSDIEQFIFRPGFSTAREVTNVSGRGVGLDVVRANVESIGGSIEMQSEPGRSTTFRIKIPLTLAIVSVILVRAGGQRFAIPQASVVELVRLGHGETDLGIEDLHGVPVYRLRGRLLPLVSLEDELGLGVSGQEAKESIVVLQGDERQFGLLVDSIDDSQEIVVKPLGHRLAGLPFAGATILGDGSITLILDVFRVGLSAGVVSDARVHALTLESDLTSAPAPGLERVLLIQGSDDERLALDLSRVSRLETIDRSRIERVGNSTVVQYRGEILKLIDLEKALPERRTSRRTDPPEPTSEAPVVICTMRGKACGLLVHRILDIVDADVSEATAGSRAGIKACAVIDGRVNEVIDLAEVVRRSEPGFLERADGDGGDA
ncbi:MAG: chemotaxis protein CheW [Thermoanaerobaculales bacterium]|jgi:two-component system chemotaxis sensor kinase CheA|nr:chemotaxis protein CheW [Thermoanaerobaculales bacterium]